MKAGHTLKEPFTIATGWDKNTCAQITHALNIYLAHHKAKFRVHIVKDMPADNKSLQ